MLLKFIARLLLKGNESFITAFKYKGKPYIFTIYKYESMVDKIKQAVDTIGDLD